MSIGKLIRQERLRRRLTQEELAEAVGVSAKSVRRWEKGIVTPTAHHRLRLSKFFDIFPEKFFDESEEKQDGTPSKAVPQKHLVHLPNRRNPLFTGRETVLRHLHESLSNSLQALSGLGGIGKTQTALEYAYRYAYEYQAILWVRAETREALLASLAVYAHQLSLPVKYEQDPYRVAKMVIQWLTHQQRWLLVFDNMERLDLVASFLPSNHQGHILLTTRLQAIGSLGQCIHMECMEQEEGVLLLLRRTKLLPMSLSSLSQIPESIRTIALDLYTHLGGLPLALDQAGAYIEDTGCSLEHYLHLYLKQTNTLLAYRSASSTDYPYSVDTTWTTSFNHIEQHHAPAAALLYVCAFLDIETIPEEIFTLTFPKQDTALRVIADDLPQLDYALATLRHYSLLKRDPEMKILSVHRLVQIMIRERLSKQNYQYWLQQASCLLQQSLPLLKTRAPELILLRNRGGGK